MTSDSDKTSNSSKKRGLNSLGINSQSQSKDKNDSRSKKTRIHHNYEPVVTDLFQEEAIREVAPSKGLVKETVTLGEKLILEHKVRHQVAVPPNYPYIPISKHVPPKEPARAYPFKLDPFQEHAISCIERSESVLVSAHTSAGKTVIAEYAIAQSLKNKQRVIYTSPIKALSNQKYRELQHDFKDVGLMTGDVTLNSSASCIVMTTEILRSMLYRGSEILREVAWVIFDEIHYMRDKARGVVWEETIIMLPNNVHFVFLSATIPNAMEFAEWICKLHEQPCHVVYTDFRPTPLQHYMYPDGGNGIYMVLDEKGVFNEEHFQEVLSQLPEDVTRNENFNKRKISDAPNVYKIIKTCMLKGFNPVIAFAFGKKQCEILARQMSIMDFNNDDEKELVKKVFENAIDLLPEEDRRLPSFHNMLPLLERGIGVHHSGLLPFMKEVVELLFQEGLLKVLFATETFAMGLNMPARTVVFCELDKFDGTKRRPMTSGEYIQMSGRAGRRGLDERGYVMLNIESKISPHIIKEMVKGEADHLSSAFHLKYHMILNMSRIEGISPEYMLQRSFYQFQNAAPLPRLQEELKKMEEEHKNFDIPQEELLSEYYKLRKMSDEYSDRIRTILFEPKNILTYLNLGRLAKVKFEGNDFGWGMIVRYDEIKSTTWTKSSKYIHTKYHVRVLTKCSNDSYVSYDGRVIKISPCPENQTGVILVVPFDLKDIVDLSQVRLCPDSDVEHEPAKRQVAYQGIKHVLEKHPDGIRLEPKHTKVKDEILDDLVKKRDLIDNKIKTHQMNNIPDAYDLYCEKLELQEKIRKKKLEIRDAEAILHLDELKKRKRLLRRMQYLTENDVVEFKGRIACEITTGDELILTELLLNGVFNDLSPELIAALLSCFVFDDKSKCEEGNLREELRGPYRELKETARIVADLSEECNVPIDKDEYIATFAPDLMESVYTWCNNGTFEETCKKVDLFEGNLVRNFRSLDELLRAMVGAAKCIGDIELENKFSMSIEKLKRGIIFASSLYL
ncbi:rRNA-processing arch domain-containing protein [Glomus cerebriforme]|uniref:rRNA-processing arch domain-containing protein n=1 Tax=Glomus cerebriforme TaxID=658196 RepID=A0A397TTU7_9GLOM|nr:rRNA-processing arch domain-containing protein [Glomus cerebriforme]